MAKVKISGLYRDDLVMPGETLLEFIEERGMTQSELAIRLSLSEKHISEIINGKSPISIETANKLEHVFGLSASFWNNLEKNYRERVAEIEALEAISQNEVELVNLIPFKELIKMKLVKCDNPQDKKSLVLRLRDFFRVANLSAIPTLYNEALALRQTKVSYDVYAVATWIRMCDLLCNREINNQFNRNELKEKLQIIKSLLNLKDINKAIHILTCILESCGIIFKVVPSFPKAPVQGMVRYVNGKLILCMTIRNKYADIFWFSLFHEIGHLIYDDIKKLFIDFNALDNEQERHANNFAANALISVSQFNQIKDAILTEAFIRQKANELGLFPGIIVGRLQHEGLLLPTQYNQLRLKYEWAE